LTRGAVFLKAALLGLAVTGYSGAQDAPQRMTTRPMPDLPKMLEYRLTVEKLDQYIQASRNVTALLAADPSLRRRMAIDPETAPRTIDESVKFAKEKLPELYAAVEKSGMTFREYTLFQGSLLTAWVRAAHPRPDSKVQILPENLKFVQDNHARIAATLKEQKR
jgi:hypothetical protein